MQSIFIILGHQHRLLHVRVRKGSGEKQKFIKYTMDLLSIPEYVIKKGRPHAHRCGKKPGDKEYDTANQLKKKCKKLFFQSIHDVRGCLVVRTGHGPQAEVAQVFGLEPLVELGGKTSRRSGRRATERRGKGDGWREQPQHNAQVHMHGWDDAG